MFMTLSIGLDHVHSFESGWIQSHVSPELELLNSCRIPCSSQSRIWSRSI